MHDEPDSQSKARNRENQRRSRQRQREYIASLEAKLAEHEAKGAQASRVMQAAARRVAEENLQLRRLVYGLCASKEEIEAFLAGSLERQTLQSLMISRSSPSSSNDNNNANGTSIAARQGASCGTAASPSSDKADAGAAAHRFSHARFEASGPEEASSSTSAPKELQPAVPDGECAPQKDETDCEEAAKIIAGMRGAGHPDDLRSDLCHLLGCDTGTKCSVKNSRLFELIDR